jgi:hypothetical protein
VWCLANEQTHTLLFLSQWVYIVLCAREGLALFAADVVYRTLRSLNIVEVVKVFCFFIQFTKKQHTEIVQHLFQSTEKVKQGKSAGSCFLDFIVRNGLLLK